MSADNRTMYHANESEDVEFDNDVGPMPGVVSSLRLNRPEQATEDESSGYFTTQNAWALSPAALASSDLSLAHRSVNVNDQARPGGSNDDGILLSGMVDSVEYPVPRATVQPNFGRYRSGTSSYQSIAMPHASRKYSRPGRTHLGGHSQQSLQMRPGSSSITRSPAVAKRRSTVPPSSRHMSYEQMLHFTKKFKDAIIVTFGVLLVFQLYLIMYNSFVSFGLTSSHSGCTCSFPFSWLLAFALRIFSRVVIPFGATALFLYQLLMLDHTTPAIIDSVLASVNSSKCEHVALDDSLDTVMLSPGIVKMLRLFFRADYGAESKCCQLASMCHRLASNLKSMLSICLLQSTVLFFTLYYFDVFRSRKPGITWADFLIGIADISSMSLASAATGVVLSFYFTDMSVSECVSKLYNHAAEKKRALKSGAKRLKNCIGNRWYLLEIGMQFSCVIYPLLLLVSWASAIPFSCGFSIDRGSLNQDSAVCWLVFIVAISVGQFLISVPVVHGSFMRYAGLGIELLLLVSLWLFAPNLHWSELIHILYAIVPVCFLIWYLVVTVERQVEAVWGVGRQGGPHQVSHLVSHSGLLILVLFALVLSLGTEYNHVHPASLDSYHSHCI